MHAHTRCLWTECFWDILQQQLAGPLLLEKPSMYVHGREGDCWERNEIYEGSVRRYDGGVWSTRKEGNEKFYEYEHIVEVNKEMENELGSMKKENDILQKKMCKLWRQLEDLKGNVKNDSEKYMKFVVNPNSWN